LSFYLKSPQTQQGEPAENDIFKQLNTLKQTLRGIMQEQTPQAPALNRAKTTEAFI